jgi:hypothetical protein
MRSRSAKWWVGAAFAANLFLAAIMLVARGADVHGTDAALFATGRVAFLWFWAAYAGGALTTLFGATFLPLKQRGRELGLAFAAALFVHLALVSWRCWIGAVPSLDVFIRFGTAAAFTLLLALFSLENLHALLGPKGWQLLRTIGMNYILYVFLYDFKLNPLHGGIRRLVEYLPFFLMAIAAALLQVAAWGARLRHRYAQLAEGQSPNHHLNPSIRALRRRI